MLKGTKIRYGYLSIPDKEKAEIQKSKLKKGLRVLGLLWSRGLMPADLEAHSLLTWFAFKNGRVLQVAKGTGWHRNTLIYQFQKATRSQKTMGLRSLWKRIDKKYPKKNFKERFILFYSKGHGRPGLTRNEQAGLIDLWLMGFPPKILKAHYVLWAFRNGKNRDWLRKRFKISARTLHRLRVYGSKVGSPVDRWLGPLAPARKEWFPRWGRRKK